jgi:hypothetical protein
MKRIHGLVDSRHQTRRIGLSKKSDQPGENEAFQGWFPARFSGVIHWIFPAARRVERLERSGTGPVYQRFRPMLKVKDTLRATVNLTFDGRVIKAYHGADAQKRFENEVRVLRHLEAKGCNFVPKLLEADPSKPRIITTNCGTRVQHIDPKRVKELFAELEPFGVRHDDPDQRNVTYRALDGRFCVIDFEFATILPDCE